jgi:DNA topoisomerase-1
MRIVVANFNAASGASIEPALAAQCAGLHYVSDDKAGIRRVKSGAGFRYVGTAGKAIRDEETLARIKSLVIPPAWTDVWICPIPNGHLQATGRDARGRKQYRYHPRFREIRDRTKYERLAVFAAALPKIRRRVNRHLRRPGMSREKVLATIVRLLETTYIRVGNEEYARQNGSFGLTTLHNHHADVHGAHIRFRFRGKSGKQREVEITDRRLARVVRRCQELPGQELFEWIDESGQPHDVTSADVNEYLREISGQDFTAKDFRTWAGTLLAAEFLSQYGKCRNEAQSKRAVVQTVKAVAERLGNTAAVCRKAYIHPLVLEATAHGSLVKSMKVRMNGHPVNGSGLRAREAALLAFLKRRPKHVSGARNRNVRGSKSRLSARNTPARLGH